MIKDLENRIKNEEDLKNNVIIPYLRDLGLDEGNLHFELNFQIQIGKHPQFVLSNKEDIARGRLDILVKRNDVNLFVLEIKEPGHNISENDIKQGISYASILFPQQAPFTIITNGLTTRIFETPSREELTNKNLKQSDYYRNGYHISFNPQIKYEAFKNLIELDTGNLYNFCNHQVQNRLLPLKSKVYKPEIYIERSNITKYVDAFLNSDQKSLLITGNSGVGKTNFLCALTEKLLNSYNYVLFFSATLMSKDLESNIIDDFNWELNHNKNIIQFIQDLAFVLNNENKNLIICIDAIYEYSRNNANIELNEFIGRLKGYPIKFILTCKYNKTDKFLSISSLSTQIQFSQSHENVANHAILSSSNILTDFTDDELITVVDKYNKFFGKTISPLEPILKKLKNPFMLRIFFENVKFTDKVQDSINYHQICSDYINEILKNHQLKSMAVQCLTLIAENILALNTDKVFEQDISPTFYESIELLSDLNVLTITCDEKNRRQIFFTSDDIRKYFTCYHLLKLDKISSNGLKIVMEKYENNIFVSEMLIWYRREEKDREKKKLLEDRLFDLYRQLGIAIMSKYQEIVKRNFPFLESKKGIVFFYDPQSLGIYAYSFINLIEGQPQVNFEIKSFIDINVMEMYDLSIVRRTYGFLFEDLTMTEEIKEFITREVKTRVKRQELDEKNNYGLLKERLFNILHHLYQIKVFPFEVFEMVSTSCAFLEMNVDAIINSSPFVLTELIEAKNILNILEQKNSAIDGPLLPLGDNINIGESTIGIIKNNETVYYKSTDTIIYRHYFYSKEKLIEFLRKFYENFFIEYKLLIETNFPNHKENFEMYSNLPCRLIGEVEEKTENYGSDVTTYLLSTVIFQNRENTEVEISLKVGESIFDQNKFTVLGKEGLIKLDNWLEWGTKDVGVLFAPKGIPRTNEILREYIYNFIDNELRKKPIEPQSLR